jgi:acetyl-CoA carboxylase biotin carboxyl carrier protein
VNLETEDFKIVIKTAGEYVAPQPQQQIFHTMSAAPAPAAEAPAAPAAPAPAASSDKFITINSPMIGTFYRRPSPDKELFVNVGDEVKVGQTVCIIEAMKLFNEIESEIKGKIVKVLVEDQSPVEYDQPLFLVDPS